MSLTTLLITKFDIAKLKEFDTSTRDDKINPYILSAQRDDIANLLGERLYNALIKDPSNYADLLDEGVYTYNGVEYQNYGLKSVIALYAHARFSYFGSATYTPYGIVEKINQGTSEQVSINMKKSIYGEGNKEAFKLWQNISNFLVRTQEPLFINQCQQPAEQVGGFTFNLINKY